MTPVATTAAVELTALVLLACATAGWLMVAQARIQVACGLAVLVLAPVALLASVTGDNEASLPPVSPTLVLAAAAAGLAVLAAVTALFTRYPRLIAPAVLLALPIRLPLVVGGESIKLLLPLYLVIAAAVCARAWAEFRGNGDESAPAPKTLDLGLSVVLVMYALQAIYSGDSGTAAQNMAFFYAPFALLYRVIGRVKWDRALVRTCFLLVVGLALVLVLGGVFEFATGRYLINPPGIKANDFDPYFRVRSLFFDPNVFGRFIAIVMVVVAALLLYTERSLRVLMSALVLAVLWVGLVLTLSQTSIASLLVGLTTLAALRWRAKPVLAAAAAAGVFAVAFVLLFSSVLHVDLNTSRGAETATSGRFDLVVGGVKMVGDRPLLGYGSGSYSTVFIEQGYAKKRTVTGAATTSKSHTAPLTVAAEQGLIGFAAYLFLLILAFQTVFRRVHSDDLPAQVARVAVAAAFTALFVHSLAYAALFEDPLTWTLLGMAVSLNAIRRPTVAIGNPTGVSGSDEAVLDIGPEVAT